jgi:hypothetical protein
MPLPAHHTKHLPLLQYDLAHHTFTLAQQDSGHTNGSALWLGAQCLSLYLLDPSSHHRRKPRGAAHRQARRPRAIELGSGIGLSGSVLHLAFPAAPTNSVPTTTTTIT